MNSAEYLTLRKACGLSQRGAAAFHGVAPRTIPHWETARNNIPEGAAEELRHLNATIERAVRETLDLYMEQKAIHGEPDAVTLICYRTPESYADSRAGREGLAHPCHNALIGRMMIALERIGARVTIAWG